MVLSAAFPTIDVWIGATRSGWITGQAVESTHMTMNATKNLLAPGTYIATATGFTPMLFLKDKEGKELTPRVKVRFMTECKHLVDYTGYLTPAAAAGVSRSLAVIGFDIEKFETFDAEVKGRVAQIKVEHEVDTKGETWARVAFINPVPTYTTKVTRSFFALLEPKAVEEPEDAV